MVPVNALVRGPLQFQHRLRLAGLPFERHERRIGFAHDSLAQELQAVI